MSNVIIINNDFRNHIIPAGLVIKDPPYNQGYAYNNYNDKLSEEDYIDLLSKIPRPCVIIHYPEETINILPKAFNTKCEQVVSWVYNSNTGKQSRLISWWDVNQILRKYGNRIKTLMINEFNKGYQREKQVQNYMTGGRLTRLRMLVRKKPDIHVRYLRY